jgi:hypothetical protein
MAFWRQMRKAAVLHERTSIRVKGLVAMNYYMLNVLRYLLRVTCV